MNRNTIVAAVVFMILVQLSWLTLTKAQSDVTPPVLAWITVEPRVIDLTGSQQTLTATAHITDDMSGFFHAEVRVVPEGGSTTQFAFFSFGPNDRISGNAVDGVYAVTQILSRDTSEATWVAEAFDLHDLAGNYYWFYRDLPDVTWYWEGEEEENQQVLSRTVALLNDLMFVNTRLGTPTPAITGTPTPAITGTPTPAITGTPTPAITGTPTPAITGTPTPAITGTPTPAITGTLSTTPGFTQTPVGTGTTIVTATLQPPSTATLQRLLLPAIGK